MLESTAARLDAEGGRRRSPRGHRRWSIRTKALLAIVAVVLLFGAVHILTVHRIVRGAMREEFYKKGLMLTWHLAYQIEEAVLYEDETAIQRMLWRWKSDSSAHDYALVSGPDGSVIASTFPEGMPVGLAAANRTAGPREHICRITTGTGKNCVDVAVPLLKGAGGWVRLGLDERPVEAPERRILLLLLLMVGFFILVGTGGALIFSRWITRPVDRIIAGAESFKLSGQPLRLDVRTGDEMETLARSFEAMTARLHASHSRLTEMQRKALVSQQLAALGLLASGIAHEINNPLAAMQLALKRIAKDPRNAEQVGRYLPGMQDGLRHMQHVIEQTLRFARPAPLTLAEVSVEETVEQSLILVRHRLARRGIGVRVTGTRDCGPIRTDKQSLVQILVNLLLNATDAMPDGGELTIESRRVDGQLALTVGDTGGGIEREHLSRIWEPFFTTKESGEGTGLGLSVTRSLVERLSGRIQVNSEIGRGSRFQVLLPAAGAPPS